MLQILRSQRGKRMRKKWQYKGVGGASKLLERSARDKEHSCVAVRDVAGEYSYEKLV